MSPIAPGAAERSQTGALLVLAGIAAPLLYVFTVILGGAIRPGYDHLAEAVSALTEARAPNKVWLDALFFGFNVLLVAFGIGVLATMRHHRLAIRISALAIIGVALLGLVMWSFPMDPVGAPVTGTGQGHLILAGLMSFGTIVAVFAFAAGAWRVPGWRAFSVFSFLALAEIVATGALTAIAAGGEWPTVGLWERMTIGGYLVWIFVLAWLLRREPSPAHGWSDH